MTVFKNASSCFVSPEYSLWLWFFPCVVAALVFYTCENVYHCSIIIMVWGTNVNILYKSMPRCKSLWFSKYRKQTKAKIRFDLLIDDVNEIWLMFSFIALSFNHEVTVLYPFQHFINDMRLAVGRTCVLYNTAYLDSHMSWTLISRSNNMWPFKYMYMCNQMRFNLKWKLIWITWDPINQETS